MGSPSVFAVSLRLPPEFEEVVEAARSNPAQAGVRHICASLYVYSDLMIDGFVEQSSNYVHLFLVQALAEQLEQVWRVAFSGNFSDLFPKDEGIARERQSLEEKLKKLSAAKARSTTYLLKPWSPGQAVYTVHEMMRCRICFDTDRVLRVRLCT